MELIESDGSPPTDPAPIHGGVDLHIRPAAPLAARRRRAHDGPRRGRAKRSQARHAAERFLELPNRGEGRAELRTLRC